MILWNELCFTAIYVKQFQLYCEIKTMVGPPFTFSHWPMAFKNNKNHNYGYKIIIRVVIPRFELKSGLAADRPKITIYQRYILLCDMTILVRYGLGTFSIYYDIIHCQESQGHVDIFEYCHHTLSPNHKHLDGHKWNNHYARWTRHD